MSLAMATPSPVPVKRRFSHAVHAAMPTRSPPTSRTTSGAGRPSRAPAACTPRSASRPSVARSPSSPASAAWLLATDSTQRAGSTAKRAKKSRR